MATCSSIRFKSTSRGATDSGKEFGKTGFSITVRFLYTVQYKKFHKHRQKYISLRQFDVKESAFKQTISYWSFKEFYKEIQPCLKSMGIFSMHVKIYNVRV